MDDWTRAKLALTDPRVACERLGLTKGAERNRDGFKVHCPMGHGSGNTPSCSVITGPDGTIQVHCFSGGCELSGSLVDLVAAVYNCNPRSHECMTHLCETARITPTPITPPTPRPVETRKYTEPNEYMHDAPAIWERLGSILDDSRCTEYLAGRGLSPAYSAQNGLLKRFQLDPIPRWAWVQNDAGKAVTWQQSGHLLVIRTFDINGVHKGLRGWMVTDYPARKRTVAARHKHGGLVMANQQALSFLTGRGAPGSLIIAEGEPDFIAACQRWDRPTLGIYSGSWTPELAEKIPAGTPVAVYTDHDTAGDQYAKTIADSLKGRCRVIRGEMK